MPFDAENCMQNVKKNQKFFVAFFFHLDGKKCLHKLNSSVLKCKRVLSLPVRKYGELSIVTTLASVWALVSHFKAYAKFVVFLFLFFELSFLNYHWPETFDIRNKITT